MSDMHQCSVCKEFYNREVLSEVCEHWAECWDGPTIKLDKEHYGKKIDDTNNP